MTGSPPIGAGTGAGPPPALELADVDRIYPGHPPVHALRTISLTVEAGELVGIVGPSGSGKSTLLHIIGTLDRPSRGEVRIGGIATSELNDRQMSAARSQLIGFVFQQFFLIDGMSALDNVANGLLYRGVAPAERRAQASAALEQVGLGHRVDHIPSRLSGGERQRVAIARAIVHRPAIVLADEPTGNLDSRSGETIMGLLRDLNRQGRTILIITHDRDLAAALPRQVFLRDGRIESDSGTGTGLPMDRPADGPPPLEWSRS